MIKQSYQVIKNINMNLMQLEWVKKELTWISYELNKILELFLYKKHFRNNFTIKKIHGLRALFRKRPGVTL
jgi:hypothetical protein